MTPGEERRKSLRVAVRAECFFNVLASPSEYSRGNTSFLKRLRTIDSLKAPAEAQTETKVLLTRIDQKLSILVEIQAERASNRKSYIHHGMVLDISEHGMAFTHLPLDEIEKGSVLEIGLNLPIPGNPRIMDIAATVIHVRKSLEPDKIFENIFGVEFFDIRGKDQNEIVQWIFSHQREQLRRQRSKEG